MMRGRLHVPKLVRRDSGSDGLFDWGRDALVALGRRNAMRASRPQLVLALSLIAGLMATPSLSAAEKTFRAGAAKIDITPSTFPVIVNGGILEKSATKVSDTLHARALVLDDGTTRIALCVVDTCMMMRELIDGAKGIASKTTGIPTDRMLVSATHTHSAPSAMGCLGTRFDAAYAEFLTGKIAEVITRAAGQLQPARVGWAVVPAWEFTNCRRWIRRPDKMLGDPFGETSVRANMHPGYLSPDVTGPSGPIDPDLSLLSVQTRDGRPLALLANFSMHYFGGAPLSADYYGEFAERIGRKIGAAESSSFIGIMSQGTSGDSHWMDYSQAKRDLTREQYADGLMEVAAAAYRKIGHQDFAPLAMAETTLTLRRRVADEPRLAWARKVVEAMGDRIAKNREEVYAQEQVFIHDAPERELKLQAIRIGGLGIATIPNEVFAITGLKLKAQSPFSATFNVELANGADGYIPPPEQHKLGGYTTWAARTAGLVPEAEPRIVETVLGLLEKVSGETRRPLRDAPGPYARAVLASQPAAYWRLNEFNPPTAFDATSHARHARYEDGIAMYLPGAQSRADAISAVPELPSVFSGDQINRAPHLAGGRIRADVPGLARRYSVEFWFWNALATDARPVTGYLFSLGQDGDRTAAGDHLGIGGTVRGAEGEGRLFFYNGNAKKTLIGGTRPLGLRTWHHVVLTRDGEKITAYLDGKIEFEGQADYTVPEGGATVFLGGRLDRFATFEGKLDEAAVYDRVLGADEIAGHFRIVGRVLPTAAAEPNQTATKRTVSIATPAAPVTAPGAITLHAGVVPAEMDAPLSPEESLKKIHLPTGYRAELVAAEPLVLDPVAFDWDERGRLWVVEMADYPLGLDGNGKPGGRVRVLEDTDGDGRYDKSTIFADGLNFPNGILTWRGGAIITAAPEILYLADTDGDGRADKREVLVSGLMEINQQLRANGLRWGLDNWVYVAAGSPNAKRFGGELKLKSVRLGQEVFVGGRDFRFRPDTGELEPQSGPTQYGRSRDNWGRWFGTQNAHPFWHYVLPEQYLRRNPHFGVDETRVQLLKPAVSPPVYPASVEAKRYHDFGSIGHYTSACGGWLCRDPFLFGPEGSNALVCEPVHNLVQRLAVTDKGVSFAATPVFGEGKLDFFASEDRWCRPVMVREGPDGAVWVADMYRAMIEHPQFLPPAGREEMLPHYRRGDDRGRLYRVSRVEMPAYRAVRLDNISTYDLVTMLGAPSGWRRDKAHQVLLWRADRAALDPLQAMVAHNPNPLARLHALCVLDGLAALTPALVARALGDVHPGVRENALRLAETRFTPEVLAAAVRLVADADAKVRMQLAFSLGASEAAAAGEALGRLLTAHESDPWMVAAVMSSATPHLRALIAAVASKAGSSLTDTLLTIALGLNDRDALASLLSPILTPAGERYSADQLAAFARLLDQLAQRKSAIVQLRNGVANDPLTRLLGNVATLTAQARRTATNSTAPAADRIAAAALLSRDPAEATEALRLLATWLDPKHPAETQGAAIQALATIDLPAVPGALAKAWPTLGPSARSIALNAWMSREAWAFDLVRRIERKELAASAVDVTQRARLMRHDSGRIRQLAGKVLDPAASARSKVMASYAPALSLKGDPVKGHQVFTAVCAVCHLRGSEGRDIGPDLLSVVGHAPEKLLGSILDPSADIQPGYSAYTCTLNTGEQLYGLLASETASSVVMKLPDGTKRTVLRNQIKTLQSQNLSLMPEGLEGAIDHQQMADLIAFLRTPAAGGN